MCNFLNYMLYIKICTSSWWCSNNLRDYSTPTKKANYVCTVLHMYVQYHTIHTYTCEHVCGT